MKVRTLLEGCGASILVMLPYAWSQLSPYHSILYHSLMPSHSVDWGILTDLVGVGLLAAFLFAYLDKKDTGLRSAAWSLIAAKFAIVVLYVFLTVEAARLSGGMAAASPYLSAELVFGVILVAGLILYRFCTPAYRASVKVLRFLLLLVGLSMLWMIPELLYLGLERQPVESAGFEQAIPAAGQKKGRRIVWLLFDELSYDQSFEHPYAGVTLPVLDQLKGESLSFEALRPAGYFTERVIPSLFLGHVIEDLRSDLEGRAIVKLSGESGWRGFDGRQTLFMDARQAGWTTGVVGWHNPYCRILAGELDSCFWRPAIGQLGALAPYGSFWDSALEPVRGKLLQLAHKDNLHRQDHEDDLRLLMQHAEMLIQNENIRFVFIHLPIPHPPGIYDRKTGQMRAGGTYIDNLALADRSLGDLISALNRTASASKTTLVICSDHSWRVPIWRGAPGWTKEEEAASQGRFDPRPVLMIHFPGQSSEIGITESFNEIVLHDILLQMLRGNLNSPPELTTWLQSAAAH